LSPFEIRRARWDYRVIGEMTMKALPVLDERATGIDVGSESLHISIAGDSPRVFGTMTCDLDAVVKWLQSEAVRTVAIKATGV